ncbi:hypothetical protein CL619_04685 [archaeon]|nr:hypothetical protein [archaeon]|tara:strand:+ start:1703 stop:2113 length:411 start_codon:yes stop_codon:yes gene_type:complete
MENITQERNNGKIDLSTGLKGLLGIGLMEVGVLGLMGSAIAGMIPYMTNTSFSPTLYSFAAQMNGAEIERYWDNCSTTWRGTWGNCDLFSTVEYNGDNPVENIAAHMPRGSGLLGSLGSIYLGFTILPTYKREEDE